MSASSKGHRMKLPLQLDPMVTSERQDTISTAAEPAFFSQEKTVVKVNGIYCQSLLKYGSLPPIPTKQKQNFESTDKNTVTVFAEAEICVPKEQRIADSELLRHAKVKALGKLPYARKQIEINYRKALEPKVMSPFEACPGKTPRLIEIERKKREYLAHDLSALIGERIRDIFKDTTLFNMSDEEIIKILRTSKDNHSSMGLPLEIFDDYDQDPRTINDWLDVSAVPDDFESALKSSLIEYPKTRGLSSTISPHVI